MKTIFLFLCLQAASLFCAATPVWATRDILPETLPLESMIGQMIMVGFRGDGSDPNSPEMRTVLADIRDGRLGGVILFERDWQTKKRGRNIRSVQQVAELCALLQKNAPIPLFIGIDQEGGRVQRFRREHGFSETPSAAYLGASDLENTHKTALTLGSALRAIGINVNFAPVADVAVHPDSPAIGALGRAFSDDVETAARHAVAFMDGQVESGIIGSYKHFPGHGSATTDTHKHLTDITETWREEELTLYKSLPPNGPFMIMTGHLIHRELDPLYPASLSKAIPTGLLREKLGWQGVVITDDLEMNASELFYSIEERVRLAIDAGVDIIMFANNLRYHPEQCRRVHAAIMEQVRMGKISPERIAESWKRIRTLKKIINDNF